jgi:hypothetical protein
MIIKGTFSVHRLLYVIVGRKTSRNRVFLRGELERTTNDRLLNVTMDKPKDSTDKPKDSTDKPNSEANKELVLHPHRVQGAMGLRNWHIGFRAFTKTGLWF